MDYNGNRTCIQRGNYHRMAANCSCENRTFPVEVNIPSRPVGISYVTGIDLWRYLSAAKGSERWNSLCRPRLSLHIHLLLF